MKVFSTDDQFKKLIEGLEVDNQEDVKRILIEKSAKDFVLKESSNGIEVLRYLKG